MIEERLAKEKLEDEVGVYFEYSRAKYNEDTKTWTFSITNKKGLRVFRATSKDDFAPYIALSEHLKIPFETFVAEYVWIYGEEIEIIPNKVENKFCYTQKGWLPISEIIKSFTDKFGVYAKGNLLQDLTWKLIIDKNECSSSTYKKNDKPGWPNVNVRVALDFRDLEDKIIKCEKKIKEISEEIPQYTKDRPPISSITQEEKSQQNKTQDQKIKIPNFVKTKNETCIIHFDGNGGNGSIDDIKVMQGDSFKLPSDNSFCYENHFFLCYSTDKHMIDRYLPEDIVEMPKNKNSLTFYAVWGRLMFVSSEKLNIYEKPWNNSQDIFHIPTIKTLNQGEKVIFIENTYQGLKDLWVKVIFLNENENIECIGFTEIRYLRSFAITNILIGNMGDNKEITEPDITPNLYAKDIAYLWVQIELICYCENIGEQSFFIKIIDNEKILKQSTYSPDGYTDLVEMNIEADEEASIYNMVAWGTPNVGETYWPGNYIIEIWHSNNEIKNSEPSCIATKSFTLK